MTSTRISMALLGHGSFLLRIHDFAGDLDIDVRNYSALSPSCHFDCTSKGKTLAITCQRPSSFANARQSPNCFSRWSKCYPTFTTAASFASRPPRKSGANASWEPVDAHPFCQQDTARSQHPRSSPLRRKPDAQAQKSTPVSVVEIGGTTAHREQFDEDSIITYFIAPKLRTNCFVAMDELQLLGF